MRRFTNSLVTRLVAIAVVTILLGLGVRLTMLPQILRGSLQQVVTTQLSSLASYVASDIDGKIRFRRDFLAHIARDMPPGLLNDPQALQDWLGRRQSLVPVFNDGLVMIHRDGKGAFADFPRLEGRRERDFSDRDWFIDVLHGATFAMGAPQLSHAAREPVIVMAVPVFDEARHVVAVLAGNLSLEGPDFLDRIQNNRIGSRGGFLLVSPRDNLFVASSDAPLRLQPLPRPGRNHLHDLAMQGWRGSGITVNAFGVEEVVAVADVPSAQWFVVARMPSVEAFALVADTQRVAVRNSIITSVVVIFLLLVILVYLFRPMRETAHRMRRMADRLEPLAPLPVRRQDEVGEMVEGFNYLVEKLQESERHLAHLAHHDALTGLPNRLSLLDRLRQGVALARRQGRQLGLFFIDLDGFKPVNDRHGHEAGDRLLQQVALRLQASVREADTVARFGGDEFVVYLSEVQSGEAVARLADKIMARLAEPYLLGDFTVTISASVGVALFPRSGEDVDHLLASADAAMYAAKRAGANSVRYAWESPGPAEGSAPRSD